MATITPRTHTTHYPIRRYTMDEINAMLDEAERQFEAGEYLTSEEVWDKYKEELEEEEEKEELQLEAV